MKKFFLVRLDDACPQMDKAKWLRIEDILDQYGIKPLVGIIPNNEDPQTCIDEVDSEFAKKAKRWQDKGWAIALHGFNHVCSTTDAGINPLWNRSEFAGLSLNEQKKKIKEGYKILKSWGLEPMYFFAPSHTYDENTLKAIAEETPIRIISDAIALHPYKFKDFVMIPCQMGKFRNIPFGGIWTFCFHPNNMNEVSFIEFEEFVKQNVAYFIGFDEIDEGGAKSKSFMDKLFSFFYFAKRGLQKK